MLTANGANMPVMPSAPAVVSSALPAAIPATAPMVVTQQTPGAAMLSVPLRVPATIPVAPTKGSGDLLRDAIKSVEFRARMIREAKSNSIRDSAKSLLPLGIKHLQNLLTNAVPGYDQALLARAQSTIAAANRLLQSMGAPPPATAAIVNPVAGSASSEVSAPGAASSVQDMPSGSVTDQQLQDAIKELEDFPPNGATNQLRHLIIKLQDLVEKAGPRQQSLKEKANTLLAVAWDLLQTRMLIVTPSAV